MDEALGKLARKQWGVFSRAQAHEQGATDRTIRRLLATGRWAKVVKGVYRFPGAPSSWHQKVSAATLSIAGAMASHKTAAFLWDLEGLGGAPAMIEVVAGLAATRYQTLAKVHHTRRLPNVAVMRQGIATTPLARTLLDLSDVLTEEKLFIAFDSARRKSKAVIAELERELKDCGNGRRHRERLEDLLKRWKNERPTESPLEARAAFAMERHGTLRPTRQFNAYDPNGRFIARADFAWVEHGVVLQCDSHAWHLDPEAFEKDLLQRRRLESHGWRVVHVTSRMLANAEWLVDLDRLLAAQAASLGH